MTAGTFYAVGIGPGDPELLTRKAVTVLENCSVIAAPKVPSGEMLALRIASGAVDLTKKNIIPLEFSMARNQTVRAAGYSTAANSIAQALNEGQDVAMVNLGDVSIYSTAYYVLDELRRRGFETQMIPGIPSFCAVAATLGRSLTNPDSMLHIIPAGAADLDTALALPGTKVLMKSGRSMPAAVAALERHGLAERSAMVADCGLPTQQIFHSMRNLPEDISYFATVIVPDVGFNPK